MSWHEISTDSVKGVTSQHQQVAHYSIMSGTNPLDPLIQASSGNTLPYSRPYRANTLPESKSTKKRRKKGPKEKANGDIKALSATPGESNEPSKTTEAGDDDSQPEEAAQDTLQPSTPPLLTNGTQKASMTESAEHAAARFEVLVKDRDALRVEVAQLRQSLEELQVNHQTSLDSVRQELQETQTEKEHAEEQYQTLLGRVNTIKSQLGERLKADAVGLMRPEPAFQKADVVSRKTLPKPAPASKSSKNKILLFRNSSPLSLPSSRI
jgi:hypothetical protein